MELHKASNGRNIIYFDDNRDVIYEWDGDIIKIERMKAAKHGCKIQGRIQSVFSKDTNKIEVLYNEQIFNVPFTKAGDLVSFEIEIPVLIHSKDEIQFRVTCAESTQKSRIEFLKEKYQSKIANEECVAISRDWCVVGEKKLLIIKPNGGTKGRIKGAMEAFVLNRKNGGLY